MIEQSFANQFNYSIVFFKIPTVVFFMQEFQVPEIRLPTTTIHSQSLDFRLAGEKIEFDENFTINYALDEKLETYTSLIDWAYAIRNPDDTITHIGDWRHIVDDAILIVRGNNQQPVMRFQFIDCFPTSISGPRFTTTASEPEVQSLSATFNYSYFKLLKGDEVLPGISV